MSEECWHVCCGEWCDYEHVVDDETLAEHLCDVHTEQFGHATKMARIDGGGPRD